MCRRGRGRGRRWRVEPRRLLRFLHAHLQGRGCLPGACVIVTTAAPGAEALALGPALVLQHGPSLVGRAEVEEDRWSEWLGGWRVAREDVRN